MFQCHSICFFPSARVPRNWARNVRFSAILFLHRLLTDALREDPFNYDLNDLGVLGSLLY